MVDRIADRWRAELLRRVPGDAGPRERLRAYVDHALSGEFDASDLVLLADVKLREQLSARWFNLLEPWLGLEVQGDGPVRARARAARLLADGAWFNKSLGAAIVRPDELADVRALALGLLDEKETA